MAVNKLDITMMEDVGTSASQLLQRDGSGNIPAVDGSQITGVTEFTTSTSDPAIDTNPSGGVGSLWYNKTGGEMYVCTDATADANVWTNVGAGSGNVRPGTQAMGDTYGYHPARQSSADIEKYSFTSDGNSVDVANLTRVCYYGSGSSSATHGFMAGGFAYTDTIDKHQFATTNNATDHGNLTANGGGGSGTHSDTYGFMCGGAPPTQHNRIERFAFASNTTATDWADLSTNNSWMLSCSEESYGRTMGGSPTNSRIEKFPFATQTNATNVATLAMNRSSGAGNNSAEYGYAVGGATGESDIEKFAFASDGDGGSIGDLSVMNASTGATGVQEVPSNSQTHGYQAGGYYATPAWRAHNVIQKFSTSTDADSTDVGDLVIKGVSGGASCLGGWQV